MDLADLGTIKPAVDEFLSKESRLDSIRYNAGVMATPVDCKTKQVRSFRSEETTPLLTVIGT
jgi:retinol dehydrogenase-12